MTLQLDKIQEAPAVAPVPDNLPDGIRGIQNVCQYLMAAKHLIENDSDWTTGTLVRRENGHALRCAAGALNEIAAREPGANLFLNESRKYLQAAVVAIAGPFESIESFNDRNPKGHTGVMNAFDLAILKAKAQGVCEI